MILHYWGVQNSRRTTQYASAARGLVTDEERLKHGFRPDYTRLVTNLGIFELNKATRLLELVVSYPGVSLEQIKAETGFEIILASSFRVAEQPTPTELKVLRTEIDPLGIRRLEFVPSKDRTDLINELLDYEEAAI